jgi:hypothetical protein
MRRLLALKIVLFALSHHAASAQDTWHGVHFGEARDDVRTQLAAQNIQLSTTQDGTLQSNSDYELALPSLRHTIPMVLNFHFDDNARLIDVTLALDVVGMHRYWGVLGNDDALFAFAAEHLTSAIASIYGVPLYRSDLCDAAAPQGGGFCLQTWRGNGQTVAIERSTGAHAQRFLIRYQPIATDL